MPALAAAAAAAAVKAAGSRGTSVPQRLPDEGVGLQQCHQASILALDVPQELLVPAAGRPAWPVGNIAVNHPAVAANVSGLS